MYIKLALAFFIFLLAFNTCNYNLKHFFLVCHVFAQTRVCCSTDSVNSCRKRWDEFSNSCKNHYPSLEDEGELLHKVVIIPQQCIIIRQLITFVISTLSTTVLPGFAGADVSNCSSAAMYPVSCFA